MRCASSLLGCLLLACVHRAAPVPVEPRVAISLGDTAPAAGPSHADVEGSGSVSATETRPPTARLAPGHRCAELSGWERPPSACIADADAQLIAPRLRFEFDDGRLDADSVAVVDEIAVLLLAHPEIERLEIHGHTDSQAGDHY